MSQIKERIQIQDDHPVFEIMPGINLMAVRGIEEGMHHRGANNYDYDVISRKGPRVCVRATIEQSGGSPYIRRDMILQAKNSEEKPFGRVVIKHNLQKGDAGFVPGAGQALYYNYAEETSYFESEGSLVKEGSDGVRHLVGDGVRFDDGDRMSVAIDASGIAVTMSGEDFANISFDQSHVRMAVENIDHGVYTYLKELYFFE